MTTCFSSNISLALPPSVYFAKVSEMVLVVKNLQTSKSNFLSDLVLMLMQNSSHYTNLSFQYIITALHFGIGTILLQAIISVTGTIYSQFKVSVTVHLKLLLEVLKIVNTSIFIVSFDCPFAMIQVIKKPSSIIK